MRVQSLLGEDGVCLSVMMKGTGGAGEGLKALKAGLGGLDFLLG